MEKTATVKVDTMWQHPVYKKRVKRSKKYLVHDELGVRVGQTVRFGEIRPISKRKRWRILEVIE
ncbi:30S ribosomal protein S17 [Candidatus Beckwithbacteria bacterium RBG_13_42_9]|uniref:30S ribosomal protein S17 n=1 Tax=Candidatus Beckwithbacteria bacterium RBG_13_42_9 TaxID=1797457 RepID=A0A1F5E906_9BACT|nr:MAG: 30S ribosomal protein S17 [Candidatus Beckwithbacteria bacterium RBG_13_42_9]